MHCIAKVTRCALWLAFLAAPAFAQTAAEQNQDDAVGASVNYVFATDLGSGIYDLDGRTLQVYRFTYKHDLREARPAAPGVRFVLPLTAGFFDFNPFDVVSEGPPTRVDSISLVPGFELDYLLRDDWHLIPYARAGLSFASSSVGGILYGAGLRVERRGEWHGWDQFLRSELSYAGVQYRHDVPADQFVRLRHGVDITRGMGFRVRGREPALGLYAIFDLVVDPPTAPVADGRKQPIQAELGFTLGSRPALKIWRFDAPRIGFGYRLAGELSSWRFVIGVPF
ncbi:MAG TPA: hypothetical protein VK624_01515 [Steroidobacteraceae bacterium]|nr:hypothetical protein [Steroidobacteraceae bacterium]